jgi:hypothetical protein
VHPVKKEIFAQNAGHSLAVFKEVPAERRTAAALVAKWMNAPRAQALVCIAAFSIPVSKGAMNAKELQDFLKTDEQYKAFVDLAPYGWRWPGLPSAAGLNTVVRDPSAVFKGETGIKAWLAETQRKAQVLVDADLALLK